MKIINKLIILMTFICVSAQNINALTPETLKNVLDCFAGKSKKYFVRDFMAPVKIIEVSDEIFFGVEKDQQKNVDFAELKQKITKRMNVFEKKSMQVIGDSTPFSAEGTKFAQKFLNKQFAGNGLIEYGFTGAKYMGAAETDANGLVNNFADMKKGKQAGRVLGNVVGQTYQAFAEWGSVVSPNVSNFMVVYNQAGSDAKAGFTKFGDDVIMSDSLLQAATGDTFICLEGGPQSFEQIINALRSGITITLVKNLRKPNEKLRFSTTEFLSRISEQLAEKPVQMIYDEYLTELTRENDARKTYLAKTLSTFVRENLFSKVADLCTFVDGSK